MQKLPQKSQEAPDPWFSEADVALSRNLYVLHLPNQELRTSTWSTITIVVRSELYSLPTAEALQLLNQSLPDTRV